MPKKKTSVLGVNQSELLDLKTKLIRRKFVSEMLDTRIELNQEFQVLSQYLSHVYDPKAVEQPVRVYPHFLPTQSSGRWSTTNPPLPNFPPDIRDVFIPDAGMVWVGWDLDAIEAKIVAAFSHDKDDLKAFNESLDIHTLAACKMIGLELPPDLKDPHASEVAKEWRERHKWGGKDDRRRLLAKVRYCLLYGRDHTAVGGSKYERDMVLQGFKKEDLTKAAQLFLRSKPNLVATKKRYWDEFAKSGRSYTIFGRRRMLFGEYWSKAKEGFNHMVQGSVTDMTNTAIIELCHPDDGLGYLFVSQAYDGAKVAIPEDKLDEEVIGNFKRAVEKPYEISGEKIVSTATWGIYYHDGRKEHLS